MTWLAAGITIAFAVVSIVAAKDVRRTLHEIRDELRRGGD